MDSRPIEVNRNYTTTINNAPIDSFEQQQQLIAALQRKQSLSRNLSISTATTYSQRDSRVQSIYDRYLYRQESKRLGRNPSVLSNKSPSRAYKRLASIKKTMSHSTSTRKKRQSVAMTNRESKPDSSPWAGMMMGDIASDDDDDDDSDNDDSNRAATTRAAASSTLPSKKAATSMTRSRDSWSSRAVAVGSRPPDSASQNPPTLKLLGLRSQKEGGAPIGFGAKQTSHLDVKQQSRNASPAFDMIAAANEPKMEENNRIVSTSDYGDDVGRHGSYIEFGQAIEQAHASPTRGYQLHDGPTNIQASSSLALPVSNSARGLLSPRTALTKELGLITPQPSSPHSEVQPNGYFPPMESLVKTSPPRNLIPSGQSSQQAMRFPQPPSPIKSPFAAQSIPLQRGQPSPGFSITSPNETKQASMNLAQMRSAAPAPMPIPLPSPVYPPSVGNPPNYHNDRPDDLNRSRPAPGFSDTPQTGGGRQMARRQPSLLRRSMAFITGSDPMQPPQRQSSAGTAKKGLWRRSMAILTNRPTQPTAVPVNDYLDSPLPRVAGFVDEKPKSRKSEYLGASGMGDEWDYSGYGAKFWKRFSLAQRREMEGANKDSETFRRKMARRRKYMGLMSLLGGLAIIGGVIAIIVWRESVSSPSTPPAVDRQNQGVNAATTPGAGYDVANGTTTTPNTSYITQTEYSRATDQATTSTTRRHHHTGRRKRAAVTASTTTTTPAAEFVEVIKREVSASAPSYFGGVHPLPRSIPVDT